MAYKFKCTKCGKDMIVRWLKPDEMALCHKCGTNVKVPANAAEVENDLSPLPEPAKKEADAEVCANNCPACAFVEKINAAEFEEALPMGTFGACHRYPPGIEGRYPFVTAADWCGEYQRRE
ncbi:MAG: hypothetical protein PHV36_04660 [Elusimicrobiales bacterium]|nr:hypothetical protein [Elusimicrobiales bacterium]